MSADTIKGQMASQERRLRELKMAQAEGDARLGNDTNAGSPRGVCARMRRVRERMRSIFPDAPQVIRVGSWIVALATRLWHMLLGRAPDGPASEPVPKGWPPSWPVLMPRLAPLRRAWKQRFGEVMTDVETLNAEGKKRNETAKHCQDESGGLPERLEKARRLEMRGPRFAEPTPASPRRSLLARIVEFLRTWRLDALFESDQAAPAARPLIMSVSRVVTLDGLLNQNVAEPISEEGIQGKFDDPMTQYRTLLEHIDTVEREVLQETH